MGSDDRNFLPYPLLTSRESARTSTPVSLDERMRRPAACFTSSTASGSEYRAQARSSRWERSQASGSVGLAKGSLGMITQRSVSPEASNPSQNALRAKSDEVRSWMKWSRRRRAELILSWQASSRPRAASRGCKRS